MTLHVLGISGPIACGKSTVSEITLRLGALEHIDADAVVHGLMEPDTSVTKAIQKAFGAEMIGPDGSVDRRRLGQTVFGDSAALQQLEALVDPGVREAICNRIEGLRGDGASGVVTVEAIRLLDSPLADFTDAIWLVTCGREAQWIRIVERLGGDEKDATRRLTSGPAFDMNRVDELILNDGTLPSLKAKTKEAWRRTLQKWSASPSSLGSGRHPSS